MTRKARAASRSLQASLAIIASITLLAAASPVETPQCELDEAWVSQHASALPATLSELSKQPYSLRKRIYARLPLATRKALWREQLTDRVTDARLSEPQRSLIRETIAKLDVYFDSTTGRAALITDRFDARVKLVFDLRTGGEIFGSLGPPPDQPSSRVAVSRASFLAGFDRDVMLLAAKVGLVAKKQVPDCNCATTSPVCWVNNTTCAGGDCHTSISGCGGLWQFPCDGTCQLAS